VNSAIRFKATSFLLGENFLTLTNKNNYGSGGKKGNSKIMTLFKYENP